MPDGQTMIIEADGTPEEAAEFLRLWLSFQSPSDE